MQPLLLLVCGLLLLALPAGAQERNLIGLVNDPDCPLVITPARNPCFAELYCGVQQVYLVAYNVWNDSLDVPITNIGGFEGKLVLPPEVLILGVEFPPMSIDFKPLPEYVGETLYARLTPVHVAYQSIDGRLAITDANDGFRLMAIDPYGPDGVSVDYTEPSLCFGDPHGQGAPCVVADAEQSWGTLKALYR